tara:strand:- start:34452 stop:35528 length:1077 start_codon:yes stop_codon:yes gene_type:complete
MTELKVYKKPLDKKSPKVKKLFIAGVGAVGNTLLKQVSRYGTEKSLRVLGVCNSNHLLWYDRVQGNYSLRDLLRAPELDWENVIQKLISYDKGSVVFVDTTGSLEIAELYPRLLKNHIHVVTPSKLANTQKQAQFDTLHQIASNNGVEFLYETNVGAGLPIINSIKNLILTGDEILELSGVLSGTMTYLFSELDKGATFSETIIKARRLGYAEPDPRDDLSGEDVARKFMILARICGHKIEREQLEVESLIPKELKDVDSTTFLERVNEFDGEWKHKCEEAKLNGQTLRYVGRYYKGLVKIGIQSVPISSALGQLRGTTNLISIRSRRYNDQPLVIQGPGAGKEVTAAGVLADLLSIG